MRISLEIVNANLPATVPNALHALPASARHKGTALVGRRNVIFDSGSVDCSVYRRESLRSGEQIHGPAIIQEYASTTALFAEDRAKVTASVELLIHVGGA
jgi:N-methylhydantoinase A